MTTLKLHSMDEIRQMLLKPLSGLPEDTVVYFGAGDLALYRVKHRGERDGHPIVQVEFNEVYAVTLDPAEDV